MINASKEFKNKLKSGRMVVNYADVTLSDETVLHLEPKDIMVGGCTIDDKTTDGKFGVGSSIGKTLSLRISNHDDQYSVYDFYKSIITLYVAMQLDDGTIEKIRKGIYYTTVPETPGDIIEISAVDAMYRLDRDYAESTTTYPATLQTVISGACLDCGIPIGFTQFDNMSFVVQEKPDKATYRDIVSYACQIAGYNARIDNNGYMQLVWYNTDLMDRKLYDGGDFKQYPHNKVLDGGNFTNYATGKIISGGTFTDVEEEHIFRFKSLSVGTDDVVITGVRVVNDETEGFFGETGYVITVDNNPFTVGKEQEVANYLGGRMVGLSFRPFSGDVLGNPLYEPFDVCRISDRKGRMYRSVINSVSYTVGGYTQIACEAEDPVRRGSVYSSPAASAVVEARRNAQKQITEYDKAVQNMNQIAMNAMGFHTTFEDQPDGSRITYLHDKPNLSDSKTVYKQTIDGFFVSQDGGKSYTSGFDSQGNVVVNILYAIGIVADWIRSGKLVIKKGNQTTLLADADTGKVRIVADYFALSSGETIESIAQKKAEAQISGFVSAVYSPEIAKLQAQIDGQIETWYYDHEPTLANLPASDWNTEVKKAAHEGDLFFWKAKGYSYRFLKENSTWKWQLITDSDITKALAQASKAQDTADGKRRVFVAQPVPPYDIGDLWVQGTGGDIMRCKAARQSGSYVAGDWTKASKYTDDSALEAFITGDFAESVKDLQAQDDKKAETWYQPSDPSAAWTTAALKNEHKGDMWFNSTASVQRSYRWNGTSWDEMKTNPPQAVFDKIDGKAQIFVAQPKPPYDVGDLWVQGTGGDIMRCKAARQSGAYAASDWEKASKYIDKAAAESAASAAVNAQTQESILNKLTNNGADDGIYLLNGRLYISLSAMRGDVLILGRAGNTSGYMQILDANGIQIGKWDKDGLKATKADITGKITAESLTLDAGAQVPASNISGLSSVATSGKYTDLLDTPEPPTVPSNIITADDVSITTQTDVNGIVTKTITVGGKTYTVKYSDNYVVTNVGIGSQNTDKTSSYFKLSRQGLLEAHNAIIYGTVYAKAGKFAGDVDADNLSARDSISVWKSIFEFSEAAKVTAISLEDSDLYEGNAGMQKKFVDIVIGIDPGEVGQVTDTGGDVYTLYFEKISIPCSLRVKKNLYLDDLPTTTSGANMRVTTKDFPIGMVHRVTSSARRYKNTIRPISDVPGLAPEKLYDVDVVAYRYNDDYLSDTDQRYHADIPGFIADDIFEKYRIACDLDDQGHPEMWNINIMFPSALKLIQDQHKEIEDLRARVEKLDKMMEELYGNRN